MWQAEADTELTLSASPATAVGQSKLYPGESRLEYGTLCDQLFLNENACSADESSAILWLKHPLKGFV